MPKNPQPRKGRIRIKYALEWYKELPFTPAFIIFLRWLCYGCVWVLFNMSCERFIQDCYNTHMEKEYGKEDQEHETETKS